MEFAFAISSMKITAKQYAQSLYESVQGKSQDEIIGVLDGFAKMLATNGDLNKFDKIKDIFVKVWNESEGIVEAGVTVCRELDQAGLESIRNYIKQNTGANTVDIKVKVDPSLLGGAVMRYGDKILDGSLRNGIVRLKEEMAK